LKNDKREYRPFLLSIGLFLMGYVGIAISLYPWIIPFQYDIWQAAASPEGLSLMLVGVLPLLPIILGYTGYCYYVFRGKASDDHSY
jgi:cytochrome d ubiquinol oxidase subunit II